MNWKNFRLSTRLNLKPSIVEKIYTDIAAIDAVKNSWQISQNLLPKSIERLTHCVIVTSTGASNRIEGNHLSDTEVEALYKNLRIKKFNTRDEQEVAGYLSCLELVFQHYNDISINESFILKLHHDMLRHSEKDTRHKGQYKFGANRVEAKDHAGNVVGVLFDPTPPHLVKKEMQELIQWYHWAINEEIKHPLLIIANFIFEFLAIHPFQDGNGRISRLLTNLMLLQQGYPFTSLISNEKITEANKADYYLALNRTQKSWKTQTEDMSSWLLFFLEVIKTQSQDAFALLKNDTIEYLLSEKQLALFHWAAKRKTEFSRKDAIEALKFPPRTIESIIKKLTGLKALKRIGQGKATRYRLRSASKK